MDPPVPAAAGKDSSAGAPWVALPWSPWPRVGRTEVGVVWPGAELWFPPLGCPGRRPPRVDWARLPTAPAPPCGLSGHRQAGQRPFRILPRPGSPRASRPCPAAGPVGAARPEPPFPLPLLSPLLEGPRPGVSTVTPSGRGAPSPQSPGSPLPQGSAGPHVGRTPSTQLGTGPRCTDMPVLACVACGGPLGSVPVLLATSAALASLPCAPQLWPWSACAWSRWRVRLSRLRRMGTETVPPGGRSHRGWRRKRVGLQGQGAGSP